MTHEERLKIISEILDSYTPIYDLTIQNISVIRLVKDIINHPEPILEIIKSKFEWLNEKLSKYNLKYFNVINRTYNEDWSYIEDKLDTTNEYNSHYEYTQLIHNTFEIDDNLLIVLTMKLPSDSKYYKYFNINYDS